MRDEVQLRQIMADLFDIQESRPIYSLDVPHYGAKLIYCWEEENGHLKPIKELVPTVFLHIEQLPKIQEHNKLIMDFRQESKECCILLAEGDRLIGVNCYHTADFGTAIYYMLELLNKSQINPQQSVVNLYGSVTDSELERLGGYVKSFKICPAL